MVVMYCKDVLSLCTIRIVVYTDYIHQYKSVCCMKWIVFKQLGFVCSSSDLMYNLILVLLFEAFYILVFDYIVTKIFNYSILRFITS